MAKTYTADLAGTWRDYARFALGDTDTAIALVTDEEIAALSGLPKRMQLKQLALYMANIFARRSMSSTNDQTRLQYIDRAEYYTNLADSFASAVLPPTWEDGAGYSTVGAGQMDAPDLGDLDNTVLDNEDPLRVRYP